MQKATDPSNKILILFGIVRCSDGKNNSTIEVPYNVRIVSTRYYHFDIGISRD